MHAAVMHAATALPRYETFADPEPQGDEVTVQVLAAGLHPLVRLLASGTHYTSTGRYPLIPGVDGVAQLADGRRVYIGFLRPPYGTFAERAVVAPATCLPIPETLAAEVAAGIINPGMSSVAALRVRGQLQAGEAVLILGATGSAGQLAVQLARALGARRVVAAGRNAATLARLDADATLRLDQPDFAEALLREVEAHGVDVVLDYLWGDAAATTLTVLASKRAGLGARRVRFVQIGDMAGATLQLSARVLRSTAIELLGSGLGSVSPGQLAACVAQVLTLAAQGALRFAIQTLPLAQITAAWQSEPGGQRIVLLP